MFLIGGFNPVLKELTVWLIASALFGLLSKLIFDNDKLSLPFATLLHCIGCFVVTISAGLLCGYSRNIVELIVAIAPIFVIVYVLIFVANILTMKVEAKKANENLDIKK
jgi:uncharacterized membrane protein YeaQ/YmgE (transglycosylase-associated protein family)